MTTIFLDNITQTYGTNNVVAPLSLTLQGPSINMLLGPSGCGKSTILRMMGGVRPQKVVTPSTGKVMINGELCVDQHDDAVTVFQTYSNRPDMTVRENIEFPFTLKLWKKEFTKDVSGKAHFKTKIDRMIEAVGLTDKQKLYPHELSGGQNQRVALARALALGPKILLMDEPFGALDHYTRKGMQKLLVELYNQQPCLIVMVTHDVAEAVALGDRIIMMAAKPGRVVYDQVHAGTTIPATVARGVYPPDVSLEQHLITLLEPTA